MKISQAVFLWKKPQETEKMEMLAGSWNIVPDLTKSTTNLRG